MREVRLGTRRLIYRLLCQSDLRRNVSALRSAALRRDSSRICIDASHILEKDYGSGVQRVTRNVITCALKTQPKGTVSAVNLARGRIEDVSRSFLYKSGAWWRLRRAISQLDMLLMLDGSWALYPKLGDLFSQCHAGGIPIVTCVYDLIPIDLPETCNPGVPELFRKWLDCALIHSEAFVCISETTARRLQRHIEDSRPNPRAQYKIGWWQLGADFRSYGCAGDQPPAELIDGRYVLVVGTLEPRKNHPFILDSFESLWDGRKLDQIGLRRPARVEDGSVRRKAPGIAGLWFATHLV